MSPQTLIHDTTAQAILFPPFSLIPKGSSAMMCSWQTGEAVWLWSQKEFALHGLKHPQIHLLG